MSKKTIEKVPEKPFTISVDGLMPNSSEITSAQVYKLNEIVEEYFHITKEIEAECKRKELSIFNLGMLTQRLLMNTIDLESVVNSVDSFEITIKKQDPIF